MNVEHEIIDEIARVEAQLLQAIADFKDVSDPLVRRLTDMKTAQRQIQDNAHVKACLAYRGLDCTCHQHLFEYHD